MNIRLVNYYIILFAAITILLNLFGVIDFQFIKTISYTLLFLGISIFYKSFLKQYKIGVLFGSMLFLSGSQVFICNQFEIINFGSVFIPSICIIVGFSLFISNLITKKNNFAISLSLFLLSTGVLLFITRGSTNFELFILSFYSILKIYWVIVFVSLTIVFICFRDFKKDNSNIAKRF